PCCGATSSPDAETVPSRVRLLTSDNPLQIVFYNANTAKKHAVTCQLHPVSDSNEAVAQVRSVQVGVFGVRAWPMSGAAHGSTTVVLAEEWILVRQIIGTICTRHHLEVVGEAGTWADLVTLCRTRSPDVVLAGANLPDGPFEKHIDDCRPPG